MPDLKRRIHMSRIGPPPLPAIEFEGKQYEQVMNGEPLGLPQRTGYMSVMDMDTGERIGEVRVYVVDYDPDLEADVQDLFFVSMELDKQGRRILIENEHGKLFAVEVDGLSVTPLN
jgi:hypothetical protein